MNFGFLEPWFQFLPRDPQHVIGLMGSGGKTSLMRELAARYAEWGVPVVLTTTTRTEPLDGIPAVTADRIIAEEDLPPVFFLRDGVDGQGKWLGLTPDEVDALGGTLPDRVVLVEVDGAAKMPLKLHREDEPLWPRRTSLALIVMGTAGVGSSAGSVLHRHGDVFWPPLAGLNDWTVWEWRHQKILLLEPGGYLDRVPEAVPAVLALTGMSQQEDSIGLFAFAGEAMDHPRLPLVMFCGFDSRGSSIRTAWRSGGAA